MIPNLTTLNKLIIAEFRSGNIGACFGTPMLAARMYKNGNHLTLAAAD
jgi:hypothetical protein